MLAAEAKPTVRACFTRDRTLVAAPAVRGVAVTVSMAGWER